MGIAISGILFDGPYSLSDFDTLGAAVYSVLYKQADSWHLVYVGESDNLDKKDINLHPKRICWVERAGSELNLYIAIHPMPDSTQRHRQRIQSKIKYENEPPCND